MLGRTLGSDTARSFVLDRYLLLVLHAVKWVYSDLGA